MLKEILFIDTARLEYLLDCFRTLSRSPDVFSDKDIAAFGTALTTAELELELLQLGLQLKLELELDLELEPGLKL
jgi:hypothetical protein